MDRDEKYLGDAVYASIGGYHIVLTANKDSGNEQTIYIEPSVFIKLVNYADKHWPGILDR